MLLTNKIVNGVRCKNDFRVSFSDEERLWMTKNGCRVVSVEARRFPRSETVEFVYTTAAGGTGGFRCRPEEFFVELHRMFHRCPIERIWVNATLPGFDDETFD